MKTTMENVLAFLVVLIFVLLISILLTINSFNMRLEKLETQNSAVVMPEKQVNRAY